MHDQLTAYNFILPWGFLHIIKEEAIMAKITKEYCSQFNSYNGEPVTLGKTLAPFVVPEYLYNNDDTIIKANLRKWYQFGIVVTVGFIVVDEEDFDKMLYIFNITVNERFRESRYPGRCVIGTWKNGTPRLCPSTKRCTGCQRRSENLPRYKNLSDYIRKNTISCTYEDDGTATPYDVPDNSAPVEDEAVTNLMSEGLIDHMASFDPRYAKIVSLALSGYSKEEIIKALDLLQSRGYEMIRNAKKLAKAYLMG